MNDFTELPINLKLVNKINAQVEFTYPSAKLISGKAKRLHKSLNPSLKYENIQRDMKFFTGLNNVSVVGIKHGDNSYEVVVYADFDNIELPF